MPHPHQLHSLDKSALGSKVVILDELMHLIILVGDFIKSPLHVHDFLLETVEYHLFDVAYRPHLILDMGLYLLNTLSYLVVALIHWEDLVEFVLVLPEDAISAQQPILGLAKYGDYAVVLEASDGVIRSDQDCVGIQGMRQLLPVLLQLLADIRLRQWIYFRGGFRCARTLVGVGSTTFVILRFLVRSD